MNQPKISVIIPAYNEEKNLRRCIKAVYESDYRNFEVIVVDDASTDNSAKVAVTFPCVLVSLKDNLGSAQARNEGAKKASGDILVFIDADIIVKKAMEIAGSICIYTNTNIEIETL